MTKKKSELIYEIIRLFVQGDTNKWDLPADIPKTVKELQFNKQEAFKYMFLGETKLILFLLQIVE